MKPSRVAAIFAVAVLLATHALVAENMRPELEASPFMDARSFDAKLSIEKVTKDNRAATVRIGLSGRISGPHVLNVYLVKVEGRWKVDDVKAVEEFSLAGKTVRSG